MAKKAKYTVAQGMQLFLIDTILQKRFAPRFKDFIGSGDDVRFFGEWSGIVRKHFSDDLSKASFKLPGSLKETASKERGAIESRGDKVKAQDGSKPEGDPVDLAKVPPEFREFLGNSKYSEYFELLEDKDLGRLMLIEYPEETGSIRQAKEQIEEELQDDEKVVDKAIRKKLHIETGAITDANYASIDNLDLSHKGLKALPGKIIEKLTGLKKLYLHGNQLTSVPESLGNLSSLTELSLSGNQLTSVPESLGNLSSLTGLSLSGNQLTSVPESLGKLRSLTELYLSGNQLTSVPESLGKLRSLTRLSLSGNQLTSVPESLGKLRSLTLLYLDGNQLTSVPESLGKLRSLTRLSLSGNQLTSVPESLGKLRSLTLLYLSGNQLTSVPESLGKLSSLTGLYLSGNQFSEKEKARIKGLLPNCQIFF